MSKRKIKQKTAYKVSPEKKIKWRRRDLKRFVFTLIILFGVGGLGLAAFKKNYNISHDLSVIGQGIPSVVQIHDPQCKLCIQLRSNAKVAMARIADENLLFRVTDITTPEGRRLQRLHRVPNVTLLLFDRDGKLNRSLNGVKSDDVLHKAFLAQINRKVISL